MKVGDGNNKKNFHPISNWKTFEKFCCSHHPLSWANFEDIAVA